MSSTYKHQEIAWTVLNGHGCCCWWLIACIYNACVCSPRWLLKLEVPKIVKSINRQLREKSVKTKVIILCFVWLLFSSIFSQKLSKLTWWAYLQVGAFSVLKELVVVLPDCLADHIGSIIPGIEKALNVSNFLTQSHVYKSFGRHYSLVWPILSTNDFPRTSLQPQT